LKAFTIACLTFGLEAVDAISLPPYKGSTFRGGFGCAFKKATCVLRNQTCDSCLLKEKCVYSYVFETTLPSNSAIMRKYPRAPHPFVLEPPEEDRLMYRPGERITFGVILIGRAIDYLPHFIYSFDVLGQMGIGRGKGKFTLKEVISSRPMAAPAPPSKDTERSSLLYDGGSKTLKMDPSPLTWEDLLHDAIPPDHVTLYFRTPARIRFGGRYTLELEFHILIRNLLRRIDTLSYFHCGERLEVDFKSLIEQANGVRTEDRDLQWFDWERYSQRQRTRMKMGGFVGSVTFRGDLRPFWPFLVLGRLIHVGKGTSFGLGRYEINES